MERKKSVLVLAHSYASFVKDQVESFSHHFSQVTVLVRLNPLAEIASFIPIEKAKPFQRKEKIDLSSIPENIKVIPLPIFYLPFAKSYLKLGEQHFKKALRAIERHQIQFDLIYCHFVWSAGYAGARLKETFHKPLVVTGHGYDVYSLPFKNEHWRYQITWTLNQADQVITVSQSNRNILRSLDISCPIEVIPNGVSKSLFEVQDQAACRRELAMPQDQKIILAIGNLLPIKGHELLISAFDLVDQEQRSCHLVIIGSGECLPLLKKQASQLGLADKITFTGAIAHDQLQTWINGADLLAMPSKKESFGVVQIEALACGVPVVATKNGGSEEIITSDTVGYLCEEHTATSFSKSLLKALNKSWDSQKISTFAEPFHWENISVKIMTKIDALC
ncbi:hypothetical protein GP2143_00607 [marine gamma proteobacterium HTCC2143]|uniref:Uncharacterized protein n=1 Tax=marine gamma proteobacterium HTCC2143 TaxID=247633 RepID=A0YEZ9_9GAMM|nr:hypothetical protein GP2143_00607 [marine gamma proteobacterium HTCC2143]